MVMRLPTPAAEPSTAMVLGKRSFVPCENQSSPRRRRLWNLPGACHCPVMGVCLPLTTLRKLAEKSGRCDGRLDDYELHVVAVETCRQRDRLSELMQEELDRRHEAAMRAFKAAHSAQDVLNLWNRSIESGDVAGALWAALTHPYCDAELTDTLCRSIHMVQHQLGTCALADRTEMRTLRECNVALTSELERHRERLVRTTDERAREIKALRAELASAQATVVAITNATARLEAELTRLKSDAPDLLPRIELKQRVVELLNRIHELEARQITGRPPIEPREKAAAPTFSKGDLPAKTLPTSPLRPIHNANLNRRTILCVGGRSRSVSVYRNIVEQLGGRYIHHDGGTEENVSRLDSCISAADLVVCQTGCISHDAYWRVKEHCKRTGKHCVFIENPSASSLARGLTQAMEAFAAGETNEGF